MKMIVLAAAAACLALAACSNAEDKAPAAPAAPAAAPVDPAAHMARTAFEGLPEACLQLADKLDRYRTCANKKYGEHANPADMATATEQAQAQAVSMAADLRKLAPATAAEACSANHEMMDSMGQDIVGPDC